MRICTHIHTYTSKDARCTYINTRVHI